MLTIHRNRHTHLHGRVRLSRSWGTHTHSQARLHARENDIELLSVEPDVILARLLFWERSGLNRSITPDYQRVLWRLWNVFWKVYLLRGAAEGWECDVVWRGRKLVSW